LIGSSIAAVLYIRNPRANHCALAFVEMPPQRGRIGAARWRANSTSRPCHRNALDANREASAFA
jgi:hypothetical protein